MKPASSNTERKFDLRPQTYFSSKSSPDYKKGEEEYFIAHAVLSFRAQEKFAKDCGPIRCQHFPAEFFIDQIIRAGQEQPGRGPLSSLPEQVEKCVIEAIRNLGVDALRPVLDDLKAAKTVERKKDAYIRFKLNNGLGDYICRIIRIWRLQIEKGAPDIRRRAIRRLKEVGRALIPDTRGKTKKTEDAGTKALNVKFFYYRELFRLYHIQNALRSSSGLRNYSLKVKAASKNFKMPMEQIRSFLGLDENDDILRGSGPITLKDMARELTAHHFSITRHRVSNILAS